jgi:hypothetical protein
MYNSQLFQCFQRLGYITEQLKAHPTKCQKSSALCQRLPSFASVELIAAPSLLFGEFPPVPETLWASPRRRRREARFVEPVKTKASLKFA